MYRKAPIFNHINHTIRFTNYIYYIFLINGLVRSGLIRLFPVLPECRSNLNTYFINIAAYLLHSYLCIGDNNGFVHNNPSDHFLALRRGERSVVSIERLHVRTKQTPGQNIKLKLY